MYSINIISFRHEALATILPGMSKPVTQYIVTANFTDDGAVAYRRADGSWTRVFAESGTFATLDDAKPAVSHADSKEQRLVCDPYAIDVELVSQGLAPLTARERIRAYGPTIPMRRPDSGMNKTPA